MTPLSRLRRFLAFARHIPPRRIARRLVLTLRRRLGDIALLRAESPAAPPRSATFPPPLFAPRAALAPRRDGADIIFDFLGVETRMAAGVVDWTARPDRLWRMTLHYMEWLEGADDALFFTLVAQWLAAHDPKRRGAWRDSWTPYALALRVRVWLEELARRGAYAPPELRARMEASAAAQLRWLESNLETDIGGNHLVADITTLLLGAAYFSGDEPARWRALGLRLLAQELQTQILPDGAHYERSPSYQCQILADLLRCRQALGEDPLDGRLDAALRGLAQAVADLVHPDGAVAQFNDSGLMMARAPADCLAAYEALFRERPAPRAVFAFPHAGWFGARFGGDYIVADCGRIAPDDLPAHGHGDALSFEFSIAGRRIFVDQGVFEYVAGEKRDISRAAASHNTLALEGVDQAAFFGAFRCGRRPNVVLRAFEARADGFTLEGAHDGYAHLPGRPVHVRRFDVRPQAIVVEDRIEGACARDACVGLLLHPDIEATIDGQVALLAARDDPERVLIRLEASQPLALHSAVWWPDMGGERATSRIVFDMPSAEPVARFLLSKPA